MAIHKLKIWPEFFIDAINGDKTFELRKDDRGFGVGDILHLQEWNPEMEKYTGREIVRKVTYLLGYRPDDGCAATFGLQPGYVILGISDFQ